MVFCSQALLPLTWKYFEHFPVVLHSMLEVRMHSPVGYSMGSSHELGLQFLWHKNSHTAEFPSSSVRQVCMVFICLKGFLKGLEPLSSAS